MGGNTYLSCDLVCSIATYCLEQFSGAFCFHNFLSDHINGPLGVEVDDPLCLYCFLFLLQTVSTPAVCKYWIKKYRRQVNYVPLALSRGECIFYIFNNSPSYWLYYIPTEKVGYRGFVMFTKLYYFFIN